MSIQKKDFCNDKRCVVLVNSENFLQLWRNEPWSIHDEERMGNKHTWPNDRKYPNAVKVFSHGEESPVPLAEVGADIHDEVKTIYQRKWLLFNVKIGVERQRTPFVSFNDGITRTLWLMVNGAEYFLVKCDVPSALVLAQYAGVDTDAYITVDDLFNRVAHLNVPAHERPLTDVELIAYANNPSNLVEFGQCDANACRFYRNYQWRGDISIYIGKAQRFKDGRLWEPVDHVWNVLSYRTANGELATKVVDIINYKAGVAGEYQNHQGEEISIESLTKRKESKHLNHL
ncbi:plasmid fertility inhibition factor family protein [Colwellia sp. MEBiC06753]